MTTWTSGELDRIGAADELEITSAKDDGTLRVYMPIWVVRVGDLYMRSYRGRAGSRDEVCHLEHEPEPDVLRTPHGA